MTSLRAMADPVQFDRRFREPKFTPSVLEPTAGQRAKLDAADGTLLDRVLREPVEFVDAPDLHEDGAEKTLLGVRATLAGNTTRFATMMLVPDFSEGIPNAAEERLHFRQLNFARMRRLQILRQFHHQRLPSDSLRLLLAWVHRELDILNRIVELNMPLVMAMVRKFRRTDLDHSDLLSEGSLVLLRCVNKFDYGRGFKFSTYACRAILKSFSRISQNTSRHMSRYPVSYDPAMEPGDFAERKHLDAKSMYLEEVHEILAENRAALSVRERAVIRARFMLGTQGPKSRHQSLIQVGHRMGVTSERVRQIQNSALRKLRDALQTSILRARCKAESKPR